MQASSDEFFGYRRFSRVSRRAGRHQRSVTSASGSQAASVGTPLFAPARLVSILALFLAASGAGAQTFGGFESAVSYTNVAYSTYGNPVAAANQVSVAVGHFCSEDYLDLAVADVANEAIEIWCGKGDGTFLQPLNAIPLPNLDTLYPSAPPVATVISATGNTQISAANLNPLSGSNLEDIVLANFQGPGTITLLKNSRLSNGTGAFTATLIPAEPNNENYVTNEGGSVSIAVGDFNGDGYPDLAVGNINGKYGGTVDVILNNCNSSGAYNFCAPVSYNSGGSQTIGIAAASLQNSKTTDDIVATDGGNVYVLLNSGTATFPCAASSTSTCQTIPISTLYNNAVTGLIAANMNGGSSPDVVVEDQYGDKAVLINDGTGSLALQKGSQLPDNYAAVAGLFDTSSSNPGLVLLASGGMMYLPNTTSAAGGSVSFGAPVVIGPFTWRYGSGAALATGDFNGDGNLDVVAVTGSEIHVVLGNGDGTFQTTPSYLESAVDSAETTSNASTEIAAVAVGNLHGTANGAMDTVSADVGQANTQYPNPISSLIVRLANPNGTLQQGTTIFQAPVTTAHFNSIVLGNYGGKGFQTGGNGAMDIAAVTTTGEIYIFQNDGNGNFTETSNSPVATGFGSLAGAVAGDFAGHGSPADIAAIGPVTNAESYTFPQSGSVVIFLGKENGTFESGALYQGTVNSSPSALTTFVSPAQLAVGSLGASKYPDIVVADSGEPYPIQAAGGVWVLQNQGNGTFSNPALVSATPTTCCGDATAGPSFVALGKLFGSAYPDIVAATTPGVAGQFLEVLKNPGSYAFPLPSSSVTQYPNGGEVAVADVNNDTYPDVLLFTGDAVQAFLNTNDPSASTGILLPSVPSYTTGPSPALTSTGTQPSLLAVGYSVNCPSIPNAIAGDAQPAVDFLINNSGCKGSAPVLVSIAVTPANPPHLTYGDTLQFTATGTYSDGSTQNLTNSVSWSSSNPIVATINSTGMATGVGASASATTVDALLGPVLGTVILFVDPAKLNITASASPNSVSYGAAVPALSCTASGFVNGDSSSSLTTQPTPTTAYTTTSHPGSYTVSCSGAADPNYRITYVAGSITVSTANSSITTDPTAASITYGQALSASTLSGGIGSPAGGSFTWTTPATLPSAGSPSESITYTPTDTTDYSTVTGSINIAVAKDSPSCTWPTASAITYGQTLASSTFSGGSCIDTYSNATVAGTFSWTNSSTAPGVGTPSESVTFTPTDTNDYTTATGQITLTVNNVNNPAPLITSTSPNFKDAESSAFTLTVNGTGFVSTSTVLWGGTSIATTYESATELTAQVPASDVTTSEVATVTVQNPAPGGGTSNAWQFEVSPSGSGTSSPPTIVPVTSSVSPGSSALYTVTLPSGATNISVTCLNLPTGASCSFAGSTLTITTSSTTPAGTFSVVAVFNYLLPGTGSSAFILAPLLLLPFAFLRRELSFSRILVLICLGFALLTAAGSGCGGGGSKSSGGSSQPSTYQTVSTGEVTLTVQ